MPTRPPIERGRYNVRVLDKTTGELTRKSYQRTTNFIKPSKDDYSLAKWAKRHVAHGLATKDHLVLQAARLNPFDRDHYDALDEIAEAAMDASGANDNREVGTALHALTEDIDAGKDVAIPGAYKADIAAYRQCLADHGLEIVPEFIEVPIVVDDRKVAGTVDRIVRWRGRHYILDLKTGSVEYSMGQIACQLAVYREGEIYDDDDGSRTPLPDDTHPTEALVIHLPAGEGKATLYRVNIDVGKVLDAIETITEFRKDKGLSEVITPGAPLTDEEAAEKVAAEFGGTVETDTVRRVPARIEPSVTVERPDKPDEGDIDPKWEQQARDDIDLHRLGADRVNQMMEWREDARTAGLAWQITSSAGISSERRYWIYRAAEQLLLLDDIDSVQTLVAWALGVRTPPVIGPGLGMLDAERAENLTLAAQRWATGELTVTFGIDGTPELQAPECQLVPVAPTF